MIPERNIIEIMGRRFLKCQKENCRWNVGGFSELEWTENQGKGTRVCNLGAKAMIEAKAVPPAECPQAPAVFELACAEFQL